MKFRFVGAHEGVTGSCTWLRHAAGEVEFLVDCGLHQGAADAQARNAQPFPFDPKRIRFVVLTHAHLDHCGLIPRLYKEGFQGEVIATRPTTELTRIMLKDAAGISDLYESSDVSKIRFRCPDERKDFRWSRAFPVAQDLFLAFHRGSHILGSIALEVSWLEGEPDVEGRRTRRKLVFSGDVGASAPGRDAQSLLKPHQVPWPDVDYLVIESTYGGRTRQPEHRDHDSRIRALGAVLERTLVEKRGKVVIPAFALHRTQEVLMDLYEWLATHPPEPSERGLVCLSHGRGAAGFKIVCDSPLARRVGRVYRDYLNERKPDSPDGRLYRNPSLDRQAGQASEQDMDRIIEQLLGDTNPREPCRIAGGHLIEHRLPERARGRRDLSCAEVFVASSGMCGTGPVVEYLIQALPDPANTIVLTGYQAPGSLGAWLRDLPDRAEQDRPAHAFILGDGRRIYPGAIKAEIQDLGPYYSGHADQDDLLDFIFQTAPGRDPKSATIFLNHGNHWGKQVLRRAIDARRQRDDCAEQRVVSRVVPTRAGQDWFDTDVDAFVREESPLLSRQTKTDLLERIRVLSTSLRHVEGRLERIERALSLERRSAHCLPGECAN